MSVSGRSPLTLILVLALTVSVTMDAPGMPMPSSEPHPHSTDNAFVFPPLPSADVFTPHSRNSFGRRPSPDISASVSGGLTTEHRLHVGRFARQQGRVGVVEEEESEMASVSGLGAAGTEMMVDDDPSEWDGVDLPPDLPAPRQTTTHFHWDIPDPKTIFRGLVFGLADQAQVDAVGCRWECESWVGEYGKETDWNLMAKVGREVRVGVSTCLPPWSPNPSPPSCPAAISRSYPSPPWSGVLMHLGRADGISECGRQLELRES